MTYDVIIIGAGLGGLQCAYTLSKSGLRVCVLEANWQIGGCLQTFRRGKATFDTGFHYVGGLNAGGSLHGLFRYFDLLDLPWQKLDDDCFDEVFIGEKSFPFASSHENFQEKLAEKFPHQRQNLKRYTEFLKNVGENLPDSFSPRETSEFYTTSLFAKSAKEFLNETIGDETLRKVLAGTSLKMELHENLPLYIFAQINNSFIQSAWRLRGGGSIVAEKLAEKICSFGGEIRTRAEVTELIETDGKITEVEINNADRLKAKWVISNAHPATTLDLVKESKALRKIYRRRIDGLENTFGFFTANIRLKENSLKYQNKNIFLHRENADLWNFSPEKTGESVLISFAAPENGDFCQTVDLLTPISWAQVEKWYGTKIGQRGVDYEEFKQNLTEKLLDFAGEFIGDLREKTDAIFTSTPLSYQNYTFTKNGSAYGIKKDFSNPMGTILTPRTPISNLLLTGQNLNLHGVLGVSMTSIFTCAEILGMDFLVKELEVENWK